MRLGLSTRLKSPNRARAKRLGMFVGGILSSGLIVPALIGLRVNASPSLPVGLRIIAKDGEFRHRTHCEQTVERPPAVRGDLCVLFSPGLGGLSSNVTTPYQQTQNYPPGPARAKTL